ncbi:MAG TPA: FAD-dependent oxidoreductase, partial [Streptomyces sp.]|uniref:FAD-dependent oxidoreductase n=1 Tax=Streptomyces sp. TaxID=1931 RepID=UPI002CDAA2D1
MADAGLSDRCSADLVVVGGGPAGAAAAITAATAGLSVVLLEAGDGSRARPGETLHPGVEVVLQELGAAGSVRARPWVRHAGHWVEWGGPPRFLAFGGDADGPWSGFQAPRAELDALLLERAGAAGASVRRGCRALDLTVTGGRI